MDRTEDILRALRDTQARLEAIAEQLEADQQFSDAHRLNAAINYIAAVARTLSTGHE